MLGAAASKATCVTFKGEPQTFADSGIPFIRGRAAAEALVRALPRVERLRIDDPESGLCSDAAPVVIQALACRLQSLVVPGAIGGWTAGAAGSWAPSGPGPASAPALPCALAALALQPRLPH